MAPIRRYLRITKYSVLEVRIYLHKPSDATWLLSTRDPVLPRIIKAVRPKVLPKLREENENAKKKGGKKKRGIKDVVSREDFEVSIFLKETSTRHSLLTKQKSFSDKSRIKSTGNKLMTWVNTSDNPVSVEDDAPPAVLREEEEDESLSLNEIPEASTTSKRKAATGDDENEAMFVSSSDEEFFQTQRPAASKRRKRGVVEDEADTPIDAVGDMDADDKKKMMLDTSYDGFSIYGRILCLIVTRKGKKDKAVAEQPAVGGSQMMEQWVSTQAAGESGMLDDDD